MLIIISVACLGAIIESITQKWEFWVPPLIISGLISGWIIHVIHYSKNTLREHYYLIFCMLVSFYHGVHETSFFDVVVISMLLMVTVTLLGRKEYLILILIEFFILMTVQIVIAVMGQKIVFDSMNISRIILHVVTEICVYRALGEIINKISTGEEEIKRRSVEQECTKLEIEDFLVNISHELRTPVNVINGLSSIILKKENREDVSAIRDAGYRLARQIEDIQDYSEIQRGDVALEEDKYMVTSLLNDIIAEYRAWENRKELDFIVDLSPDVPSVLIGDQGKIKKILRHLLDNAVKFTKKGGIYLKVSCVKRQYGVNLLLEITDTGIGIKSGHIDMISRGMYQTNRKRNRSTGGIGLGLPIVYGFVRKMDGFVTIESEVKSGTTVRVCIAQEVADQNPCLVVNSGNFINIALFSMPDKYRDPQVREFYMGMSMSFAQGLRINLYSATTIRDCENLVEKGGITHVFTGVEEYRKYGDFFDKLSQSEMIVTVAAWDNIKTNKGSKVQVMPKPLYGGYIVDVLNGTKENIAEDHDFDKKADLSGLHVLVVDDEPMNLVVATGLFKEYNMLIDTAANGKDAVKFYDENDYDIVFMDHMMPGMDGVEAMKRIRSIEKDKKRNTCIIALTANAISGAKEMFLREGFDGFISKPIDIKNFERTMYNLMPSGINEKRRTE